VPEQPPARTGHPYYMHDAIYAQPGALRLVSRGQGAAIEAAAARLREMDRVLLTGVGTSWHAALVAELLFASASGGSACGPAPFMRSSLPVYLVPSPRRAPARSW